ncbi:MAG: hypothetical protein HYX75_21755 [Acidobacteria bacterium]|nr:hypothetical protein [Acidobacteriota bacterium]
MRWKLVVLTTLVLGAALAGAYRFEQSQKKKERLQSSYIPRTAHLEAIACSGSTLRAFTMKLSATFSFKVDLPAGPSHLMTQLCNLSDAPVTIRLLAGPGEKRDASRLYESTPIPPGASQELDIPLDALPSLKTRLFLEARGAGCCEIAWGEVWIR